MCASSKPDGTYGKDYYLDFQKQNHPKKVGGRNGSYGKYKKTKTDEPNVIIEETKPDDIEIKEEPKPDDIKTDIKKKRGRKIGGHNKPKTIKKLSMKLRTDDIKEQVKRGRPRKIIKL